MYLTVLLLEAVVKSWLDVEPLVVVCRLFHDGNPGESWLTTLFHKPQSTVRCAALHEVQVRYQISDFTHMKEHRAS